MNRPAVPTARDVMTRQLVTLRAGTPLSQAIEVLLAHRISGAPVVGESGRLLGLLSEFDCLRVLVSAEFHDHGYFAPRTVADVMTEMRYTITPDVDVYGIAQAFVTSRVRRLPVVDRGRLIGQVSRRDVLRAIDAMRRARQPGKRYPDYPPGRESVP